MLILIGRRIELGIKSWSGDFMGDYEAFDWHEKRKYKKELKSQFKKEKRGKELRTAARLGITVEELRNLRKGKKGYWNV